ncbi:vanadium-dependent haloperoxidase [Spirosoma areae]
MKTSTHFTSQWIAGTLLRKAFIITCIWVVAACQTNKDPDVAPSNSVDKTDAAVAVQWMDLFLDVERYAPGYRPPVAARSLGYISLAGYETVIPASTEYQSVASRFAGLTVPKPQAGKSYRWDVAVNETYYVMMKNFFPHVVEADKAKIEELYKKLTVSTGEADELTRSKAFGREMAEAVFAYSKTDVAGHEAHLRNQPGDYVPPTGVGKWQPTAPDFGKALLPYWGKVRTFVATESEKLAKPPLAYGTSVMTPLFVQGLEIYNVTTPISYEQQWIAEFWSDDIYKLTFEPAGRWLAIAQQIIKKENVSLQKAAYTYAKVGIGLSDIGVACWNSKYVYNVERPISYIQRTIDPKWRPKLNNPIAALNGVTPPFPAYPSGHSSFGAVAAEVLTDIYGINYAMTDRCHEGRTEFIGKPRSFNNFYEMAEENAYSRIPLGVHYRMDCQEGLRMGYAIGRRVNQLNWKK